MSRKIANLANEFPKSAAYEAVISNKEAGAVAAIDRVPFSYISANFTFNTDNCVSKISYKYFNFFVRLLYYRIHHVWDRWLTCTALELALLMAVKFVVQEMHGYALRYLFISETIHFGLKIK